jgi:rRNA small subunit pseudouridine methyltransferase Nep1
VVKGPVTKYFPPNARRVGFSYSSPDVVKLSDFVRELPDDVPAVFTVGAFAHGKIDVNYNDQMVSVSEYPLSAAYCICRITNAFEQKFDIV